MNANRHKFVSFEKPRENPYQQLHIYYVEGHLDSDACLSGATYLGNWQEEGSSFLFFSQPADDHVARLLDLQPHLRLRQSFCMSHEEWQGSKIQPLDIGRFSIMPPWQAQTANMDPNVIVLDPGVVFGTGTHPTTRDCIQALEIIYAEATPQRIIDLGTGTGLLALVAASLGANLVLAVDLNLLAVTTAARNVRLNQFQDRILAVQAEAENFIDLPSDVMISNIHYAVMQRFFKPKVFTHNKWIVLSGLMRTQAREVEDTLSRYPLDILETWQAEGIWHTFLCRVL
jgi:ribosomal protein L11 methyltransferase